jgi:hypothetical protein
MAGMHVRLFADRNAAQVRAVVLVDATTPEAMDLPATAHFVAIGLPAVAKEEKRRAFADPVHNRWAAAEVEAWHADAAEARAAEPYDPDWPVAVVLTGDGRQPPTRHAVQTAPANASRHGFIIHVPGSNHASLLGERHAGHVVRAILQVEAAAKA